MTKLEKLKREVAKIEKEQQKQSAGIKKLIRSDPDLQKLMRDTWKHQYHNVHISKDIIYTGWVVFEPINESIFLPESISASDFTISCDPIDLQLILDLSEGSGEYGWLNEAIYKQLKSYLTSAIKNFHHNINLWCDKQSIPKDLRELVLDEIYSEYEYSESKYG